MSDLISRKAAIDALTRKMVSIPTAGEKDLMGDVNRIRAEDISVIRRLPSAQPERCEDCVNFNKTRLLIPQSEIIRCKDCKKWHSDCLPICGKHGCDVISDYTEPDDFCSWAERRTDE